MKNKHLPFKDRVLIEDLLNRGNANLTTIGKAIGKDPYTISKEIKKRNIHLMLLLYCFILLLQINSIKL